MPRNIPPKNPAVTRYVCDDGNQYTVPELLAMAKARKSAVKVGLLRNRLWAGKRKLADLFAKPMSNTERKSRSSFNNGNVKPGDER